MDMIDTFLFSQMLNELNKTIHDHLWNEKLWNTIYVIVEAFKFKIETMADPVDTCQQALPSQIKFCLISQDFKNIQMRLAPHPKRNHGYCIVVLYCPFYTWDLLGVN